MTELRSDVVVVECAEYDHINIDANLWLGDDFETKFNSEIDGRDVLRANFRKGVLRLQATSYVGVIPLNDRVVVRVRAAGPGREPDAHGDRDGSRRAAVVRVP